MTDAPAGWYPDPTPPTAVPGLRYWTGMAWTEHVAPAVPPVTPSVTPSVTPYPSPYGAQVAGPTTPDGVPLSSWWPRVGAALLDGVFLMVVNVPLVLAMFASTSEEMNAAIDTLIRTGDDAAYRAAMADLVPEQMLWLLPCALAWLAYNVLMLRYKGATAGKLLVGLRVRRRDSEGRLSWGTIAARTALPAGYQLVVILLGLAGMYLAYNVASMLLALVLLLDVLWPLWDKRRQALHDKIARTNVVKVR